MHETATIDKKNAPKSTLDIVTKVRVVEAENKEKGEKVRTQSRISSAADVRGTGGDPMQIEEETIEENNSDQGDGDEIMDGPENSSISENNAAAAATGGKATIRGNGVDKTQSYSSDDKNNSHSERKDGLVASSGTASNGGSADKPESSTTGAAAPPPPVMKGTLSYDVDQRRHLIRGMWNYENSTIFPAQRFELLRTLGAGEDVTVLPQDGEFHGSFSLAYFHTTSKGKQKERSKVIPESGVKIKFTKIEGKEGEYKVDGKGTNQFGVFRINGTANPSSLDGDPTLHVVLRKRYEPSEQPPASAVVEMPKEPQPTPASKSPTPAVVDTAELPSPSQSFPSGVVCLRGKLDKEVSNDLGITEVVHKITGLWAGGLDFIMADPQNTRGLCNKFEYEHKSSVPSQAFPVSGRYSGWFDLSSEDGSRTRINERDVTLKFRKNNAGYYNIEGKGSNVFGKYSITGTLDAENIMTIFRHFQPRKLKTAKTPAAPAAPTSAPTFARRPSSTQMPEMKLKLEDVDVPGDPNSSTPVEPIVPPAHGAYSAVSRGVLRVNDDGSHSCQGKWAATRERFTNGQVSNFNFRLEAHFAADAMNATAQGTGEPRQFPLDSALYKGSFQLKKQGTRYQTVVDQQVVMRFKQNTQGAYNVYGKGINVIGEFKLIGTMVMSGKTGGQVELYRSYAPALTAPAVQPPAAPAAPVQPVVPPPKKSATPKPLPAPTFPAAPAPGVQRRESTRQPKLPSRLEDDDPSAQITRLLEKCSLILRLMREKDLEAGGFFSEPVDPVAMGIPTYHQIIKEPMDLRTISRRMDAGTIPSPEEFARLVRLVFENAMTFNVDPAHSVHQAARNLLVLFNQKFRDVERQLQNVRRTQGDLDDKNKKKKDDKKRKRLSDEPKSLKRQRLDEAQAMAAANASAVSKLVAAATNSPTVTRTEFNMLLSMIQQLQGQLLQTYQALADLSPGDENDSVVAAPAQPPVTTSLPAPVPTLPPPAPAPAPERKKPAKRAVEVAPAEPPAVVDETTPLSLEEQELLTETINELTGEHLDRVVQIIREAASVDADEDEIDLEIDQLDTKTQRKLLSYVSKFVKKKAKGKKRTKAPQQSKKQGSSSTGSTKKAPQKPKPAAESFFAFEGKDDSDSDEDDEKEVTNKASSTTGPSLDFKLNEDLDELHEDNEDNDEDLGSGLTAAWDMKKPVKASDTKDGDEDDVWADARKQAEAAKAREADRKAREEKLKAEAEQAKNQRLADAAARGEEIKAQRMEEEANEARLREQQEKEAEEARKAAREAARAQIQSVEQTVDLDAQRDIMKQFEETFLDKDFGSASPSSDFGF